MITLQHQSDVAAGKSEGRSMEGIVECKGKGEERSRGMCTVRCGVVLLH